MMEDDMIIYKDKMYNWSMMCEMSEEIYRTDTSMYQRQPLPVLIKQTWWKTSRNVTPSTNSWSGVLVGVRLDYCYSILYRGQMSTVLKLQRVQFVLGWVVLLQLKWLTCWTTSIYSLLAARRTVDSLLVSYPDIQDTSYINAGLPKQSDFSLRIGDQNVIAIGVSILVWQLFYIHHLFR